jgi:hypothetical protein
MTRRQGSCRLSLVVCLSVLVVFTTGTFHRASLVAEAAQSGQRSLSENATTPTPSTASAAVVTSDIIPSAGAAPLFNGVGDILPTGSAFNHADQVHALLLANVFEQVPAIRLSNPTARILPLETDAWPRASASGTWKRSKAMLLVSTQLLLPPDARLNTD